MQGVLTDDAIEALLSTQNYAHIGCQNNGEIYIVPATYIYKDGYIYSYTHEGKKIEMMRKNPNVCFQIENVTNAHKWQSAIVWGTFEELSNEAQKKEIKLELAAHFGEENIKGLPFFSPLVEDNSKTHTEDIHPVVYRIVPIKKTGRCSE